MRRTLIITLFAGLAASPFALPALGQDKSDVTLQVAKYDLLRDEVLKNRGKVVLVDFWGDFCRPCKEAFPHTVELSKKFAAQGLVVITVAIDPIDENRDAMKGKLLAFLKKQNAAFTNIWLDEGDDFFAKKFRSDTVPCMYVFDRQGKWTQLKGDVLSDHRVLDTLVQDLVKEK